MLKRMAMFFARQKKQPTLQTTNEDALYCCKIAVHTGEGAAASDHLKMWVPVFREAGYEFCIIVRTMTAFTSCVKKYPDLGVVYAKSPQDLENILENLNLRLIFYLSNTGNNLHVCRFTRYRHIFLGHGDSDKSGSAHNCFKIYDEVWVSGQAHVERFAKAGIDMSGTALKIIGQPQLGKYAGKIYSLAESPLYMPTWEGVYKEQSYSSLPFAKEMFSNLQGSVKTLAVKPHPRTGSRNRQYRKLLPELFESLAGQGVRLKRYPQVVNALSIMAEHEAYICDCSAVVSTALFFDRPLFVHVAAGVDCAGSNVAYADFAQTFGTGEEFIEAFRRYEQEGDVMAGRRSAVIDYFVSRDAIMENAFRRCLDSALGI